LRFINLRHLEDSSITLIRDVSTRIGCRPTFSAALSKLQDIPLTHEGSIGVHFSDSPISDICIANGIFADAVDTEYKKREDFKVLLENALFLIRESDENLLKLVELVVIDIVFMNSRQIGGGTASHVPGVACFSPGDNWLAEDMAESLIHEATHLSVFLCDMVHGIFTKPSTTFESSWYYAPSAVRKGDMRPLDKALHSALVTVPLLYFENILDKNAISLEYGNSFRECCKSIDAHRACFTKYGMELLDELLEFADSMKLSQVKVALSS